MAEGQAFCPSCGRPSGTLQGGRPSPTDKATRGKWECNFYIGTLTFGGGLLGGKAYDGAQTLTEYKFKDGTTQWSIVEGLGKEGWELVSVTPTKTGINGEIYAVTFFFKRPISQ
jgi:hypothetical protein